jgi:hypothetical protein
VFSDHPARAVHLLKQPASDGVLQTLPDSHPMTCTQAIDWDGFGELEMVTLACAALRSVSISHCDSLLDATCGTFADGGGLGHQAAWRCPNLRHAYLTGLSTCLCCGPVTVLSQKQVSLTSRFRGPGLRASTRVRISRLCRSPSNTATDSDASPASHCHTMLRLSAWLAAYQPDATTSLTSEPAAASAPRRHGR